MFAVAFLSHGRWVARCPRPGCTNAEGFGSVGGEPPGGLRSDHFECRQFADYGSGPVRMGGCGLRCVAAWPPQIAQIEALCMARPAPVTRNWLPGETLHDLLRENIAHGLIPADALNGGPPRPLLELRGDELVAGSLAGMEVMPELTPN